MKGNVYGCVSWCLFKILYLYLLPKRITCGHVLHSKKPRWLMYHKSIYPLHRPNIQFKTLCSVSVFDCKLVRDGPKHSFDGLEPRFGDKFDRCDCSTWVSLCIKPRTKLSRRKAAVPGRKSKAIATFVWCWCTGRERARRSGTQRP